MSILTAFPVAVNFEFPAVPAVEVADDFRPTAGPDYIPSADECDEAAALFGDDDEPTDAGWDRRADDALALETVSRGYAWM